MKLNLEQIRSITKGVTRVEEMDGYFRFFRFTEAQAQYYLDAGQIDFYHKTNATAGVHLAFSTDATGISFDFALLVGSSRAYAWFDVYVNGAMIRHMGCESSAMQGGKVSFPLRVEGEKTVEIYFPWSRTVGLCNVVLEGAGFVKPLFRKRRMIAFGDSITQGYDAIYPSHAYAIALARLLDADVTNKGIGGDVFCPEMLQDADPEAPDFITVAYGINDWRKTSPESFRKNCPAFFRRLHELYPEASVFGISPVWYGEPEKKTAFGIPAYRVHEWMQELCVDIPNLRVIRGWDFVPHISDFYSDFIIHPNDLGFGLYTQNLYRAIMESV